MRKVNYERGQTIVIVVLMLIGMLAMLALVLDGGNLYSKRRQAQNAADAGALAGARNLCLYDEATAISTANAYATTQNEATGSQATVDGGTVTVTATLNFDTFFAHLIGFDQLTAQASAAAACGPPTGGQVLPIAWSCRPPVDPNISFNPNCEEQAIDEPTLEDYLDNPADDGDPDTPIDVYPELYVIMNSKSVATEDQICAPDGLLICDFDGDTENDLIAHGGRSWLDLSGSGGGSSELVDWIDNGYPDDIFKHDWLGGQSGVADVIFQTVQDHEGEIFAIPIFDEICPVDPDPDDNPGNECDATGLWHDGQDNRIQTAGSGFYYHILGFAAFYIDCVVATPSDSCPGHSLAETAGMKPNERTIEGYFLTGYFSNLKGAIVGNPEDFGAYTIWMVK